MNDVRNNFPELFPIIDNDLIDDSDVNQHIYKIHLGEFYSYILDQRTNLIKYITNNVLNIHPIDKLPEVYQDIAILLHQEDIAFIKFAEISAINFLKNISKIEEYAIEYCFRMKNKFGDYDYFVHQSIHVRDTNSNTIKYTFRRNRNLNELIKNNSYEVIIRHHVTNRIVEVFKYNYLVEEGPKLSLREIDVLRLIVDGLTDKEIAEKLFLSFNTVRTHRKNIFKKTNVSTSIELVKKFKDYMP